MINEIDKLSKDHDSTQYRVGMRLSKDLSGLNVDELLMMNKDSNRKNSI